MLKAAIVASAPCCIRRESSLSTGSEAALGCASEWTAIEEACAVAQTRGIYRLRTIRTLIQRSAPKQELFEFIEEHPIIRPLSDYGDLVRSAFQKTRV